MARRDTSRRCQCEALEARLERVETLTRAYRKELDIQLQRIADLQALLDSPMVERRRRRDVSGKKYAREDN